MIVYDLRCHKGHVFEAWFANSAACDRQAASAKIACPDCGSRKIVKAPMAPRIAKTPQGDKGAPGLGERVKAEEPNAAPRAEPGQAEKARHMLEQVRRELESKCDYVGEQFAEEARKIHYNETAPRNIYGEASPRDARELHDEGIEFGVIPWPVRHDA